MGKEMMDQKIERLKKATRKDGDKEYMQTRLDLDKIY